MWDPHSVEPTRKDARYCFVVDEMDIETYKAKYPDSPINSWDFEDVSNYGWLGDWLNKNSVRVAEYWTKTPQNRVIAKLEDNRVIDVTKLARNDQGDYLGADGLVLPVRQTRKVITDRIEQRIINGAEVLEDVYVWPGRYIPIIPVLGEEVHVKRETRRYGVVRFARDPQRMYNYWRPLALNTPLPTPNGWTTMGEVAPGDELFDEAGAICRVVGKSPVYINRDCYRVQFDDGSHIVADGEHVWAVEERGKRRAQSWQWLKRKVTTAELTPNQHFIDVAKPLVGSAVNLPIDPYVLGFWLGDGHIGSGRITPGDADMDEVCGLVAELGYKTGVRTKSGEAHSAVTILGLRGRLADLNLLGNKHIPTVYLRAPEAQRWQLLQGLMDSDGSISAAGQCSFSNTNQAIATGFRELLRSLGIKAVSVRREGRRSKLVGGNCTVQSFEQFSFSAYGHEPVFRLQRKRQRLTQKSRVEHPRRTKRHRIVSVEKVASVPVQCVGVDAPSHLFLAGEAMVPTHNSAQTEQIALEPKAPWLVTATNIAGYEGIWDQANKRNQPYLPYTPDQLNNGAVPARQAPPQSSQGMYQEIMVAAEDMKATTGIYDAGLGIRPATQRSGRAIQEERQESDVSNYTYADNLSRALVHAGRVLVDIIPKIYDSERVVRILNEDETTELVTVNQIATDEEGNEIRLNDLTVGKYDVIVSTGPSFSTKRAEAAEGMLEFVGAVPQAAALVMDLVVKNLDWPGAEEMAKRLRRALPAGVAEPEPDEEPMEPPQPTPDQQAAAAEAEAKAAESAAKAAKTEAETEGQQLENVQKAMELQMQSDQFRQMLEGTVANIIADIMDAQQPLNRPMQ